jgi:type IV pilus assembly protein PilE
MAGVLAALVMPSWLGSLAKARRADAVGALTRVQLAQEQYRSHHGLYAGELGALRGASAPRSAEGFYEISLLEVGPEGYRATARARSDGPQARDAECRELQIVVNGSMTEYAPSRRCWNL